MLDRARVPQTVLLNYKSMITEHNGTTAIYSMALYRQNSS